MRNLHRIVKVVLGCAALVGLIGMATGCAAVGLIAHATTPPPKVPAMYKPAPVPTIVLVEFSGNPGQGTLDAQKIAQLVTGMMTANGVPSMLDPGLATQAQSRQLLGRRLRPSELARECGAKQFIYIDLRRYTTTSSISGEATDGQAEAAVWVVDAQSAEVLWPPEASQGFPIGASVPFTPTTGGTTGQAIHDQLNQQIAQKSGRLFFEWQEQ